MNSRTLLWRDLLVLFGLTGWALALPAHASEFAVSMALTCLMYVALSSSWGFFCGASRYLSLATSAFFGIGAYCTAVMLGEWSWVGVILLGAGLATLVAVVMGLAVLHLRGTYFAVLTFGMAELIRHAISYFEKSVSGTVGRVLATVPEMGLIYHTVLCLAVVAVGLSILLRRTRFGLALLGIGGDEQRAQTLGVNTRLVKVLGFAFTAAIAASSTPPSNTALTMPQACASSAEKGAPVRINSFARRAPTARGRCCVPPPVCRPSGCCPVSAWP